MRNITNPSIPPLVPLNLVSTGFQFPLVIYLDSRTPYRRGPSAPLPYGRTRRPNLPMT